MAEPRRYRQISDSELEDYLGGLPRRRPHAALREHVLSIAHDEHNRSASASSTGALIALALLLLLADFAALRQHDVPAYFHAERPAALILAVPTLEEGLLEADYGDIPARMTALWPTREVREESRLAVQERILAELLEGYP